MSQQPPQPQPQPAAFYPGQAFPAQGQAFPVQGQAFPLQGQAFPVQGQAFPLQGQAYPAQGQAFPPQGQPVQFIQQYPPGAPGAVAYYPQGAGGPPQIVMNPVQRKEPVYKYVPSDFRSIAIFVLIVFGIFSPFSLALTIPALLYSNKSIASSKLGNIRVARAQGITSAYLIVTVVIASLLVAWLASSVVLGVYGPQYALQTCIENVKSKYGGVIPPSMSSYYSSSIYCR